MKIPRDISGHELAKALKKLDYEITNRTGSHIRLTTKLNGEHHITVPDHDPVGFRSRAPLVLSDMYPVPSVRMDTVVLDDGPDLLDPHPVVVA